MATRYVPPALRRREDGGEVSDDCKINGVPVFHADSRECQFNHIEAVAAMLGDYKDVIAYIQAGYLGNWGEWNWERRGWQLHQENAPLLYNRTDRCEILDHILFAYAAAGIAQDVELRRPVFAKEVVERWENPENSDIYGEDASANVGLHNDCFMSSTVLSNSSSDVAPAANFFDFVDGSEQNTLEKGVRPRNCGRRKEVGGGLDRTLQLRRRDVSQQGAPR